MGMEMKLNLKMAQKLVMTPMLQQAIKLLPLARLELAQLVQQEIIENPVLEEVLDDIDDENLDELPDSDLEDPDAESSEGETDTEEHIPEEEPLDLNSDSSSELPDSTNDAGNETNVLDQEIDWDNYIQSNLDHGSSVDNFVEKPSIEATYKTDPSLVDHLFWQLNLAVDSETDKFIGSCIIWNIQNDGYLNLDWQELVSICNAPEEDVARVLSVIQGFEPTGVAARSLKECLLLQAKVDTPDDPLVETLIQDYLERLEERNYPKIASELKIGITQLLETIEKIREFSPKPGNQFSSDNIDYVVPDITVVKTEDGYDLALNDEGVPNIRINPYYHSLLKSTSESQTKEYLENKYRSAMWLIKSIDQRRQTIYKVGKSIVKQQTEFLDHGLSYLKPMVLKDVARDIEMHESTVSRITTNKFIDTPQGIFELKFFFHSGIKSFIGSDMSSIRVKNMIKEVIQNEDPAKPFTDDEMVKELMRKNAKIARRTVTKYRKELNIPPASKRKKLY